jgi:hypothetical protein
VASSPLDKDAKFFNKRISTIEILEKNKNHSSVKMHKKSFLFEVSEQRFKQRKKDLMADERIVPHIDILIFLSRKGNRQQRAGKRFKTEYSGTKFGRFLSFVTSSPLSKDAKILQQGNMYLQLKS